MANFWNLTGGRPMTHRGHAFTDCVSGQSVHHWRDRLGRDWLAEGAWSLFRAAHPTTSQQNKDNPS